MSEASAAIIGHELGHFAAGDTARGASPVAPAAAGAPAHQRIAAPPRMGMSACSARACGPRCTSLDRFERAYLHWNRRQELAADRSGRG